MPRSSVLRRSVLALLTATVAVTGVWTAGAANAAVRVPYAPKYHAGIDAYSSYEPETTCSIKPKPGVVAWRDLLIRTYGTRWNNISRACSASQSGHEEGRALDYGALASNATQKAQADALLNWLLATDVHGNPHAMARRLGIQYIQYNNKMWRAYSAGSGWQPQMSGGKDCARLGAGYVTTCHRDHIHFSFSWAGANKKTSYFTGTVACPTPSAVPAFTAPMPTNLTAVPMDPVRIRNTASAPNGCRLAPRGQLDVQVTGVGGVPSWGVGAVALNVSAMRPSGSGTYLGVYPAGTTWAGTSAVNAPLNGTAARMVVVPVGSGGKVSVKNGPGAVDVVVDVMGYFTTATTGSTYFSSPQQVLLDTTATTPIAPRERRAVQVAGQFGVPADATGVLVNVTSSGSTAAGYMQVSPVAGTSSLNYAAGETVANRAMVKLAADGTMHVFASTQTHVRVDLVGWFAPGTSGLRYNPLRPSRVVDTRNTSGEVGPLVAGTPAAVTLAGQAGVPADAHSVVGTFTLYLPQVATKGAMWRQGTSQPAGADLSVPQGIVRENFAAPRLSADGKAALGVTAGTSTAFFDLLGYFR